MKPASAELDALLASGQYKYADLYTLTLKNGLVMRYTSADIDITHGGNLYRSGGEVSGYALVQGGRMRSVRGLEADSTDITIVPGANDLVNGVPMLKALQQGQFDRAYVIKERAFMATWGDTSPGTLIIFTGEISEVKPSRTESSLAAKSDPYLLNIQMPRHVYQASCAHSLGDSGCGVDRTSYQVSSSAEAGTTAVLIVCDLSQASGYFDLGTVRFTTGKNAGLIRSVKAYAPGSVSLAAPFPNVPESGDAFLIAPGCGKTIPEFSSTTVNYTIAAPRTASTTHFVSDGGVVMIGLTHSSSTTTYDEWGNPTTVTTTYKDPDVSMTKVSGAPGDGQYSISGGVYTFAAANDGRSVVISYQYASSAADAQCFGVFNNVNRFTGCPYVPVPETST